MGLYVQNWALGEEYFNKVCENYWYPHISLNVIGNGRVVLGIEFLEEIGEKILAAVVPTKSKKEFIERYASAKVYLIRRYQLDKFVEKLVEAQVTDGNLTKEIYEDVNEEFTRNFYDLEISCEIPFYERLSSIIFFNSWEPVEHVKFLIMPEDTKH